MTTDDVILLIASQWGNRGLIIPNKVSVVCSLRDAVEQSCALGLTVMQPFTSKSGNALCHVLTDAGWVRWAELMGWEDIAIKESNGAKTISGRPS
jgi:hypothetical protein